VRLRLLTGNPGKLAELQAALDGLGVEVVQDDRGYPEIQADTLEEVAEAGAGHLLATGIEPPFVLEDSGLFVDALEGFPGVYSRYALDTIGNEGLLRLLAGVPEPERTASFRADLCYIDADRGVHHFAGACPGRIAEAARGSGGFGFDPVFVPDGEPSGRTFAEMDLAAKNRLSHRGQAVEAMKAYLGKAANR